MTVRGRVLDLGYRRIVRRALFSAADGDAEEIHERTLRAIERLGESRAGLKVMARVNGRWREKTTVAGIEFPGLVGVAAGLDKNGVGVKAWGALGFGHAELGTVTAQPQPGNDRPRLFRLQASQAIINRMGFNNLGAQALADRLAAAGVARGNRAVGIPIGVSIGKTKITPLEEATEDYLTSLRILAPYADYVAINVSSPNTPGLRSLQDGAMLSELLPALISEARALAQESRPVPILVKLAPDLSFPALDQALGVCVDAGVEGIIATNTTLSRNGLDYTDLTLATQSGGLSGAPLARRAREVVSYLTAHSSLPVIGVGGIMTIDDASAMLDAGASLLQLYTGYIYAGPALITELNRIFSR